MTKKERKIINLFKELQHDDWIKKYTRFNIRLSKKYEGRRYTPEHNTEWERIYQGCLKRYRKKWIKIFDIPWGKI